MRKPLLLLLVSVAIGVGSLQLSGAHQASAQPIEQQYHTGDVDVEFRYDRELHCDGDDTWVTIRLSDPHDGTPIVGEDLYISGALRGKGNSTIRVSDWFLTDRRGIVRVRIRPEGASDGAWLLLVYDVPGSNYPYAVKGPCDFDGDPANKIRGVVFEDTNANGLQDDGEQPLQSKLVSVSRSDYHWSQIPPHWQRTDALGGFDYTGVPVDSEPSRHRVWSFCIDDAYQIVSASGRGDLVVFPFGDEDCFGFFIAAGDNVLSVGVIRRGNPDNAPPPE